MQNREVGIDFAPEAPLSREKVKLVASGASGLARKLPLHMCASPAGLSQLHGGAALATLLGPLSRAPS